MLAYDWLFLKSDGMGRESLRRKGRERYVNLTRTTRCISERKFHALPKYLLRDIYEHQGLRFHAHFLTLTLFVIFCVKFFSASIGLHIYSALTKWNFGISTALYEGSFAKKQKKLLKMRSGWFGSAFLVVNATLGASLLNYPIAFHKAGVLSAVLIQSFFIVFIVITLIIMGHCSDIEKCNTYEDVVHSVCGPIAQLVCAVTVMFGCFGVCITFLIVIGDQWELFLLQVAKSTYCEASPFYMSRAFIISVSAVVFILPLCFARRIDFLKYASVVGVFGILYVVGLVTVKYFLPHDNIGSINNYPKSWVDVFLVVPNICFAYQCHVSIIPIYSCMDERNLRELSKTVTLAMIISMLTYTGTAVLGYWQFGDNITNDILLSFKPDASVMVAVVLIAVKTYTTYPITCFCGKAAFGCIWTICWRMTPDDALRHENVRRIVLTLFWFIATLLLSIFIPNIGVVIQILGAFSAVFIFIFPGMCLLKTMQNKIESGVKQPRKVHFLKWFALVFLVVGTFIFGLTFSQAIMEDIKGAKPDSSKFTCS